MFLKSLLILFTSIILWNNIVKAQPPCVNGHTNTDLSSSLSAGLYYIDTDVYGTRVYSSQHYNYKGETVVNIPLKSLAQGMYILKVYDKQNKYSSHKILKQ